MRCSFILEKCLDGTFWSSWIIEGHYSLTVVFKSGNREFWQKKQILHVRCPKQLLFYHCIEQSFTNYISGAYNNCIGIPRLNSFVREGVQNHTDYNYRIQEAQKAENDKMLVCLPQQNRQYFMPCNTVAAVCTNQCIGNRLQWDQ